MTGREALGDNSAARVLPDVDHLRPGVGLLVIIGESDRVELTHRVVTLQDAARIFPGDGRSGLHLRPRDLRVHTQAFAAFGNEVVNTALAFFVSRVPVLHGGVLDLCVIERNQLNYRSMQLVLIADRGGAAFQIAHVGALVGNDQRALELARLRSVNAEIGGQLQRTANSLWHVDK